MGSIDVIRMFPIDFEEFLCANNVGYDVIDYLKKCFIDLSPINDGIHQRILRLLQDYLISGGLPDAVKEYVINKNAQTTRNVQNSIYYYRDDCF